MVNNNSPHALAELLGERIKLARLNADLTQTELGKLAGLSRIAVTGAESGKTQLVTFLALLDALKLAPKIDLLLPEQQVSPIQLAKMQGKQRKRASGASKKEPEAKALQTQSPDKKEKLGW
jgi:transcriptional regulator with XRE-family HTH domain